MKQLSSDLVLVLIVDNRGCSEGGVASPKYNQQRQDHEPFFCRVASCITQSVEGIILLGQNGGYESY